jgi:hypothetical protein
LRVTSGRFNPAIADSTVQRKMKTVKYEISDLPPLGSMADEAVIAHHESGHAVVACLVVGHTVTSVTLGLVRTQYNRDPRMRLGEAMIACAGPLAEGRYLRMPFARQQLLWIFGSEWDADRANARRHLEAARFESCIENLETLLREVRPMVRQHWRAICAVAAELQARGVLNGDEVTAIAGPARHPWRCCLPQRQGPEDIMSQARHRKDGPRIKRYCLSEATRPGQPWVVTNTTPHGGRAFAETTAEEAGVVLGARSPPAGPRSRR